MCKLVEREHAGFLAFCFVNYDATFLSKASDEKSIASDAKSIVLVPLKSKSRPRESKSRTGTLRRSSNKTS